MLKLKNFTLALFFLLFSTSLFAQEAQQGNDQNNNQNEPGEVLIDFSELAKDASSTELDLTNYIDYVYSGASAIVKPEDMKIDLGISNWSVLMTPSARQKNYVLNSKVAPALVNSNSKRFAGETILGVKVLFPAEISSSAMILPAFKIPFYAGENGNQFENRGLVDNIKTMKEIKVTVYSVGQDVTLEILLEDMNGLEYAYPLGTLKFRGWADLIWSNPNYIPDVASRTIKDFPTYPVASSKMRFKAFRVSKNLNSKEQNLIFYIKDVRVLFDKLNISAETDIDSESIFKIYENKGIEDLRKLKARETLKRVLRLREDMSMPKGTFEDVLEKATENSADANTKA